MLEKIDRQLLLKVTFCIIFSCIMVISSTIGTHMLDIRLPIYNHSSSTYKNHTGVTNDRNKSFVLKRLGVNSSSNRNTLASHNKISFYPDREKSTNVTKNKSLKDTEKSTHLSKPNTLNEKSTNLSASNSIKDAEKPTHLSKSNILKEEQKPTPRLAKNNKATHIAFLKVHKAGSTTMQNIFFRFGLNQKLNILIPKQGNFLKERSNQMPIASSKHYDVFACHTIYSKQLFNSILPANSVKIGIVREPIKRMISAAYYYRDIWHTPYLMRVPRADFVHNLVKYPEKYEPKFFSNTRNMMAKDFGFSSNIKQTDTLGIQKYLNELNSQFMLVLTVEKFDESLVLMKRLLHWSIFDILYLKKNNHKHIPISLSNEEKAKFRNTSFLDFKIYEYFKNILDEKLKNMTKEFWEEVEYFKKLLIQVAKHCSINYNKPGDLVIQKSKWSDQFSISKSVCGWMNTNEIAFIKKLRTRHKQMNYKK